MAGMTLAPKSVSSSVSQRRRARFEKTYTPIDARSLLGCLGFSCHSTTRMFSSSARMPIRGASARAPAHGHGHVGPVAPVGGQERRVVHLVDVVACEHEHGVGRVALDDVEVLEDRVGGAAVPLGDAPALDVRLEELDAAGVAVEVPRPPESDVVVERARVVLRQDDDVVDAD